MAGALTAALPAAAVEAQPTDLLTTPYPSVAVEPGSTASFQLQVRTAQPERVDLAVGEVPDGWTAQIRGGGFVVGGVFTDPNAETPPELTLDVDVPAEASPGEYQLTVSATAASGSDTLELDLRVATEAAGSVSMTADFPQLRGASDATFSYDVTLENDTPEEVTFNLEAAGPEGWQVDARPSSQEQAASAIVEAGSTTTIVVEADPPDNVAAGDYPIAVRATGAGQTADLELQATVTGSFQMTLTTPEERLNANVTAGQTRDLSLILVNDGTAPLVGVSLTATPPSGWDVTFDPEVVESVPAGQQVPVTARLTPAGDAIAGDYVVSFEASTPETTSSTDIRVTVETSLIWAFVGIALIVLTLAGLAWVFRQYGRR
ncbi:MAG: hypothetical protein H0X16_10925 [Chloroflexi bacterium]|nr:hypothetical protein [Chloroflexota bacterium]